MSIQDDYGNNLNGTNSNFDMGVTANPVYVNGQIAGDTNANGMLDPGETWLYTLPAELRQDRTVRERRARHS
jgi:hypothetical protein